MDRTYDDRMFIETFEHEYTWLNGFLRNVRRYGGSTALIDPIRDKSWTYRQLDEECNQLANALKEDKVGKNDVVMSILNNCPEFCFTYIAPRKVGAIVSLANYKLSPGEMARLIEHNEPKVVIYTAEMKETVAEAAKLSEYKPLRLIMADNLDDEDVPLGHIHYEDYVKLHSTDAPARDFPHHIYDEVVRMCTSGTSALPKNVPLNDIVQFLRRIDIVFISFYQIAFAYRSCVLHD